MLLSSVLARVALGTVFAPQRIQHGSFDIDNSTITLRFIVMPSVSGLFCPTCVDVSILFPAQAEMPPLAFVSSPSLPGSRATEAVVSVNATMSSKAASGKRINVSSAVGMLCAALSDGECETAKVGCDSQFCPPLACDSFQRPCKIGVDFLLACFQASCLGIRRGSICPTAHLPPGVSVQQAGAASLLVPTFSARRIPKSTGDVHYVHEGLLAWLCFGSHAQLRFLGVRTNAGPTSPAVVLSPGTSAVDRKAFTEKLLGLPHRSSAFLLQHSSGAATADGGVAEGVAVPTFELEITTSHSEHFSQLKTKHGVKRKFSTVALFWVHVMCSCSFSCIPRNSCRQCLVHSATRPPQPQRHAGREEREPVR